jgi:hypothetical protein
LPAKRIEGCSELTIKFYRNTIKHLLSKTKTVVKSTISDEGIEKLRDNCKEKRDLAIIDLFILQE